MVWLFVAAALVLIVLPSRLRKIGFALLGTLFVIVFLIIVLNRHPVTEPATGSAERDAIPATRARTFDFDKYQQDKKDQADPAARTRIPLAEVRFGQVQPVPGLETGTLQSIRARLYNDSRDFALTDYAYYLVIQDCLSASEKSAAACTTVYDQKSSVSLTVPPGQARDVVISIAVNPTTAVAPFKLMGTPRIELSVTEVRAYQ